MVFKLGKKLVAVAVLLIGITGCGGNPLAAQPTATTTRTPRPTFTPLVQATSTFVPLPTSAPTIAPLGPTTAPTKAATRTPTKKPPTPKPATSAPTAAVPPTAVPPTFTPQPVAFQYDFKATPSACEHSGGTWIKGTVFKTRDRSEPYEGAIVVLGDASGVTRYDITPQKTGADGTYAFTLSSDGAPPNKGTFGVWLVTPSMVRKSDVGGPIVINGLHAENPNACWGGFVDFNYVK